MDERVLASKAIKKELKAKYNINFSVTSSTSSGWYSSISVKWNDGPDINEIQNVLRKYIKSGFDGMTDSTIMLPEIVPGTPRVDHITCYRNDIQFPCC